MRYLCWTAIIATVSILWACQEPQRAPRGFSLPDGDVQRGQQLFVELKCYSCHEVAGLENELPAPTADPLTDVTLGGLAVRAPTDGELVTSIINPSHQLYPGGEEERITVGEGSRMANYNEIITIQHVIDLVAFLQSRYETAKPAEET